MKQRFLFLASLLGLLAGCAIPAQPSAPTPYPPEYLPTVVALTAGAIEQNANDSMTSTYVASLPTETLTPETSPTPTRFPTLTRMPTLSPTPAATRTPTSIPGHDLAFIQIMAPGPMSRVTSPITLKVNISSGESLRVQIDLFGEDGRLITRMVRRNFRQSRDGLYQVMKLAYEIRAEAEVGRITISTFDKEDRIQYLNSVRVLLVSSGENEINPGGDPYERVELFSPLDKESVSGGVLTVYGDLWPYNLQPVIMELTNSDGNVLGLRVLTVDSINPVPINTTIPYKVLEPTMARLTIRQDDDRISGLNYVYSQLVQLNP